MSGRWQTESPVHSPPILGQELLASRLERIIGPQVLDRNRGTSNGIDARFLNVLDDANAIEAAARRCHDRVMHDLKGDPVNQVIRDNLREPLTTTRTKIAE